MFFGQYGITKNTLKTGYETLIWDFKDYHSLASKKTLNFVQGRLFLKVDGLKILSVF